MNTALNNPYWDEIKDKGVDDIYGAMRGLYVSNEILNAASLLQNSRNDYCRKYSWSIPDPASILFVAEHMRGRCVEMGAGTGYYSWQLVQLGIDMLCYDIAPPDKASDNDYHSPRTGTYGELTGETTHTYIPVLEGTPRILHHADRTLFLCWPPMSDMAFQCLKHYKGDRLVYIGESSGGCTGDDAFFDVLENEWQRVDGHKPVQWDGIHDWIEVYTRVK